MRLNNMMAIVAGLMCVGSALAQRPQSLPTSGEPVKPPVAAWTAPGVAPTPAAEPENILYLDLSNGGRVAIQLRPDRAPQHVARIKTLARQGFYNGIIFHRVIDGFMAQTGDPSGTGMGGSLLPDVAAEFNPLPHVRGTVSAARASDPNSANSQFFITFAPRFSLDGKYSVFGRVISGMQYVDLIERGEPPASPTRIVKASIGSDNVPPPTPAEVAAAMQRPLAPPPAETAASATETAQAGTEPTPQ